MTGAGQGCPRHSTVSLCGGYSRTVYIASDKAQAVKAFDIDISRTDTRVATDECGDNMHTVVCGMRHAGGTLRAGGPSTEALRLAEHKVGNALTVEADIKRRLWEAKGAVLKQSQIIHDRSREVRTIRDTGPIPTVWSWRERN